MKKKKKLIQVFRNISFIVTILIMFLSCKSTMIEGEVYTIRFTECFDNDNIHLGLESDYFWNAPNFSSNEILGMTNLIIIIEVISDQDVKLKIRYNGTEEYSNNWKLEKNILILKVKRNEYENIVPINLSRKKYVYISGCDTGYNREVIIKYQGNKKQILD